jgi:hypothetical protein
MDTSHTQGPLWEQGVERRQEEDGVPWGWGSPQSTAHLHRRCPPSWAWTVGGSLAWRSRAQPGQVTGMSLQCSLLRPGVSAQCHLPRGTRTRSSESHPTPPTAFQATLVSSLNLGQAYTGSLLVSSAKLPGTGTMSVLFTAQSPEFSTTAGTQQIPNNTLNLTRTSNSASWCEKCHHNSTHLGAVARIQ